MDAKKIEELKILLREAGYTVTPGIKLNVTDTVERACEGGTCTGGCVLGCYTCSPNSSNKPSKYIAPKIVIPRNDILDEIVTIERIEKAEKEKIEKPKTDRQ